MSIESRPGAGVAVDQSFDRLISDLKKGADPDALRALLRGPLHLASPLRIGDVLLIVEPASDDPTRIDVKVQNALTLGPQVTILTLP